MDEKAIDASAKSIYERHRKFAGESGEQLPGWNSLGAPGRAHWRKVVKAVLKDSIVFQAEQLRDKPKASPVI